MLYGVSKSLTIGGISMNRPIFACPHCGGVLVFNDDGVANCWNCKKDVSFDELARHIFTKHYKNHSYGDEDFTL